MKHILIYISFPIWCSYLAKCPWRGTDWHLAQVTCCCLKPLIWFRYGLDMSVSDRKAMRYLTSNWLLIRNTINHSIQLGLILYHWPSRYEPQRPSRCLRKPIREDQNALARSACGMSGYFEQYGTKTESLEIAGCSLREEGMIKQALASVVDATLGKIINTESHW